ncbi:hypothetical protein Csa_018460 [Cucumis sativus]|uniref:Uncharacterized protein n=1 Tax=Cucumis sativus TaxID=3659 RepID=A0A0A0KL99_CUCSA|nr:hypothetical protein Csa_018460 [Cucumis sativus]
MDGTPPRSGRRQASVGLRLRRKKKTEMMKTNWSTTLTTPEAETHQRERQRSYVQTNHGARLCVSSVEKQRQSAVSA